MFVLTHYTNSGHKFVIVVRARYSGEYSLTIQCFELLGFSGKSNPTSLLRLKDVKHFSQKNLFRKWKFYLYKVFRYIKNTLTIHL